MSDSSHLYRNTVVDPGWRIIYGVLDEKEWVIEESDDVDTPGTSTEQLPESEVQPKAQAQHWNKLPRPPNHPPSNQSQIPITDNKGFYYMSHADYVRWERTEAAFRATSSSNLQAGEAIEQLPPATLQVPDFQRLPDLPPHRPAVQRLPDLPEHQPPGTTDIRMRQPTALTAENNGVAEKPSVSSSSHLPAPDSTWEEC